MDNIIGIESVTVLSPDTGTRNLHSFVTDGTTIYGGTRQSPARIVEISGGVVTTKIMPSTVNPAYTNTLDLVYSNIENMALHELTGHFYANFHNQTRADSIRVIEFYNDGSEILYTDVISESWNFLTETKPTIAVIAIDNDNDYLYAATWRSEASSLECTIRRYDLINRDIDGLLLLLDTYTIPISPFTRAHSLTIDGDYLYLTNQGTAPWVVKVNINGTMALVDGYQLSSDFIVITDDAAISDGRLWVGIEAGTYTGAMVGLNIDDLSDIEIIEFPEAFPCYGLMVVNSKLLAVHYSTMPIISEIDTTDFSIVTTRIPAYVGGVNELLFVNGNYYAPTWITVGASDSVVLVFPTLETSAITPQSPIGDINMINYDLSTLMTIARHEAEINNLASRYTRKALTVATTAQMTAVPDTITAIVAIKSDGTTATLTKATTWQLAAGEYVRFNCATENAYFSLLEGTGSVLTSGNGVYTLSLASAPTWTDYENVTDWQSKIDLANQMIYDMIFANLTSKATAEDIGTIITAIENPEALCLASDYKTLELIYMDLYGKIGTAETVQTKLDFYRRQFDDAFARAYSALDFGDYGYLFTTSMGRISR